MCTRYIFNFPSTQICRGTSPERVHGEISMRLVLTSNCSTGGVMAHLALRVKSSVQGADIGSRNTPPFRHPPHRVLQSPRRPKKYPTPPSTLLHARQPRRPATKIPHPPRHQAHRDSLIHRHSKMYSPHNVPHPIAYPTQPATPKSIPFTP